MNDIFNPVHICCRLYNMTHISFITYLQAKLGLEKVKSQLEAENADVTTELRSVGASRQECERRRKQAESQLAELQSKVVELERSRADVSDRFTKLQQESDAIAAQLEQAELRTSAATKSAAAMETQLSEAQVIGSCQSH